MLKQEDWPAMAPELDEIKASYAVFFLNSQLLTYQDL